MPRSFRAVAFSFCNVHDNRLFGSTGFSLWIATPSAATSLNPLSRDILPHRLKPVLLMPVPKKGHA